MDVNKMLQELRAEKEQIEEAILSLERLARGRGRRRGRPPAWLSEMRKEARANGSSRSKSSSNAQSKSAAS